MSTKTISPAAYEASPIDTARRRRTKAEIQSLDSALAALAEQHQPITVRGLFYRAVVASLVPKDETRGYDVVQRRCVHLRRAGAIPYGWITDGARIVYGHDRWDDPAAFQRAMAALYRKDLWSREPVRVEVWIEKDAMSGVLAPVTDEFGIDLYVTRGFASLTYLENAAEVIRQDGRPTHVFTLSDFDPSGLSIAERVEAELVERAAPVKVIVERLAVTPQQIEVHHLPTRPMKHSDSRARRFRSAHGERNVELDAFEPDDLREIVRRALEQHMNPDRLATLRLIEDEERRGIALLANRVVQRKQRRTHIVPADPEQHGGEAR